jgi:DNA-binding transcriptional ArsR family regulator
MTPEQRDYGSRVFAALANPARLQIVERLMAGPAPVGEIAAHVGLKQSMTSQHLSVLLTAGVVMCNPSGNMRVYSLRGPRIRHILSLVEEFHDMHLEGLRDLLARHPRRMVVAER